jgi:hypothetical protein
VVPLEERTEDGPVLSCALLKAIGIRPDCRRSIFNCGLGGILTAFEPASGRLWQVDERGRPA